MSSISPQKPLVSINIVTFNGEWYIKKCLESVAHQTYKNIEVNILDNDSQDDTIKIIEKVGRDSDLRFTIYDLRENVGFAKGHNILIKKSRGEYIVMLNQDAWLDKNYTVRALDIFKKDDKIAALQPKIYRYNFGRDEVVKRDDKAVIDATGLVMLKNRRIIARGQGQKDEGQFDYPPSSAFAKKLRRTTADVRFSKDSLTAHQENLTEVFGADGAASIFRRTALEDIALPTTPPSLKASADLRVSNHSLIPREETLKEYFDEDFFMYKEDVDLSWRLRLYGWKIMYGPKLIAYHERGSGESAAKEYINIIRERRHISQLAKSLSWRNQRLMQVKNELPLLYVRHLPRIFLKELGSLLYILLFERYALKSIKDFFLLLPNALKKRTFIMQHKMIGSNEMARWFQ